MFWNSIFAWKEKYYVQRSIFLHKNDNRFVFFSASCLYGGLMSYLRYLCLFAHSGVCVCLLFVSFVFVLCLEYPMLPDSLDYPPWVFSNVYFLTIIFEILYMYVHEKNNTKFVFNETLSCIYILLSNNFLDWHIYPSAS